MSPTDPANGGRLGYVQIVDLPDEGEFRVRFPGLRSLPWRGQKLLAVSFPALKVSDRSIGIDSWSTTWEVPWRDVRDILCDPKAILVRRLDGSSGRFKASKKRIREICRLFDEKGVAYSLANGSTFWMATAETQDPPTDRP